MTILVTLLHIVVCLLLIAVVLLQTGKRADLAGAFGGGGSQTAFGARGAATALSKATTAGAVLFMLTSIALTVLYSADSGSSVLDEVAPADASGETSGAVPGIDGDASEIPGTDAGYDLPADAPAEVPAGEALPGDTSSPAGSTEDTTGDPAGGS